MVRQAKSKRRGTPARAPGVKRRKTAVERPEALEKETHSVTHPATEVIYSRNGDDGPPKQNLKHVEGNIVLENMGGREVVDCRDIIVETEASPFLQTSMFDPIGGHVPEKIKEKIWENKFVDLSLLLKSAKELDQFSQTGGELKIQDGKIVIEKQAKNNSINSIDTWTSAFLVFAGIMLERHPAKAQELLKYMRDIRLAATAAQNTSAWVTYDEQFRLKKAKFPQSSWGRIDNELWLLTMSCKYNSGSNLTGKAEFALPNFPRSSFRQNSCCWGYNRGKCTYRDRCKFSHSCIKCGGNHPAFSCRQ